MDLTIPVAPLVFLWTPMSAGGYIIRRTGNFVVCAFHMHILYMYTIQQTIHSFRGKTISYSINFHLMYVCIPCQENTDGTMEDGLAYQGTNSFLNIRGIAYENLFLEQLQPPLLSSFYFRKTCFKLLRAFILTGF